MGTRTLWNSESEVVWRHILNDMMTNTDSLAKSRYEYLECKTLFDIYDISIGCELFETDVLCNLPGINDCGTLRERHVFINLRNI